MVSAWYVSIDSIKPEALAAAKSRPLPWETAMERELGRQTMTTGTPIESRRVTLAIRVMPITGASRQPRRTVSSGVIVRWVPARKVLATTAAPGLAAKPVRPPDDHAPRDDAGDVLGQPVPDLVRKRKREHPLRLALGKSGQLTLQLVVFDQLRAFTVGAHEPELAGGTAN